MGWTKKQFIVQAYEEIGFASYIYDIQPEQLNAALISLNSMMAAWGATGIRIGFPLPSDAESDDIDDETNVPDSANEAIYTNLAIRRASSVGKTPSQELKAIAKNAFDALANLVTAQNTIQMQLPGTMPRGAGNKPWRYNQPFANPPSVPLSASEGSEEITP